MNQFKDKIVGICFGGQSPEHDISIITGLLVMEELARMKIQTEPIYVTTDGSWCLGEELRKRTFLQEIHMRDLYSLQRWSLDTRHRNPRLILTRRPHFFARRERKAIDIVFPAFHGTHGEDGAFQGLCELLGVPYVGSGVESCAIAMDKTRTKQLFQVLGIPTTTFVSFSSVEWKASGDKIESEILEKLSFPLFIKPVHAGSSIGITCIKTKELLRGAIDLALGFDTHCIVENGVPGVRDLTCCIRELPDGSFQASLIQESRFEGSDFFSYEEKYLKDGGAQFGSAVQQIIIPAAVPEHVSKTVTHQSVSIFKQLDLSGIGRVDFLLNPNTQELYANEINPMPGTIYHHLWKETGVTTAQLINDLLISAVNKYERTRKKNAYFHSSILGSMRGPKLGK